MSEKLAKEWQTLDLKAHELAIGGDMAGAEKILKQAIKLAKKIGPEGIMLQLNSLFGLTLVQEALGNQKGFVDTNNEMLELVEGAEDFLEPSDRAVIYTKIAENLESLGQVDMASELLEDAVTLFEEAEELEGDYVTACVNLAKHKIGADDAEEARRLCDAALTAAIDLMDPKLVSDTAVGSASIALNPFGLDDESDDDPELLKWAAEQCRKAIGFLEHPDDDALQFLGQVHHALSGLLLRMMDMKNGLAEALAAEAAFVKYQAKVEAGEIGHHHDHDHVHGPDCDHEHDEPDPEEFAIMMAINRVQVAMMYRAIHAEEGDDALLAESEKYVQKATGALAQIPTDSPGAVLLRKFFEQFGALPGAQ